MNPEANPCEDFEEFACGKYIKETVINKTLHSQFLGESNLTRKLFELAKDMLEEDPVEESPFKTDKLLRVHYKSCMNLVRIEKESLPYAKEIFKDLGGFPVIEGDSWDKHANGFNWWDMASKLPKNGIDTDVILKFSVGVDPKNTKSMAMSLDQPYLGLYRGYLTQGFNNSVVQSYYEFMVGVAKKLGATDATAHKDMKEALLFEIDLAKISAPYLERKDKRKLYNKRTIRDLEGQPGYPSSLKGFINKIFASAGVSEVNVGDDDVVIVKNLEYARKLSELLGRTSSRAMANHICWIAYTSFGRLMGKDLRRIRETFLRKSQGIQSDPPRWIRCGRENGVGWYSGRLTVPLGSLYVRKYYEKENKEKAKMMVDHERKAFKRLLEDNDWMDEKTKKNALSKLEAMGQHIAYEDAILDPKVLNNFFKGLTLTDSNSFLKNSLAISKFWTQYYLKSLRQPVDRHHFVWHQWVVITVAFGRPETNYGEYAAGFVQKPYFSSSYPMYMNYGSFGRYVGQILSAGFYEGGRYYDKDGNLVYWWDEETLSKYNEKSQCVAAQYGKYKSEQVGMYINGNKSLTENIADIAGARTAYSAYEIYKSIHGPEEPVEGHNFTPEQLLWLSLAQGVCGKYRDQHLKNLINWGYSPSKFRILGSLSNNPKFAKDFKCPLGSKMNPRKKCNVW